MKINCKECLKEINLKPSYIKKTKNITCSRLCLGNFRKKLYLGKNNPNKKYLFNEYYLDNIDSVEKAWLLGWICSDGCVSSGKTITIAINKKDIDVLNKINSIFNNIFVIKNRRNNIKCIEINSVHMTKIVQKHLNIGNGKKSSLVTFPTLNSEILYWAFLRGIFEGDGTVRKRSSITGIITPQCGIASNSTVLLDQIKQFCNIPCTISTIMKDNQVNWYGTNCLDFLGKIYNNVSENSFMIRKYNLFLDICCWEPKIKGPNGWGQIDCARFMRTHPDAVAPLKVRVSDSGYDLTLISIKNVLGKTTLYDTGIRVTPPFGYYFDLVPRSSLIKTGYILGNSVGVIDRSYLGNILVPLIKIDPDSPVLALPARVVQIILRKAIHAEFIEVKELTETVRGDGGFGSTDKGK